MSFHIEQFSFDKCIVIMECIGSLVHPHCVPLRTAVREQLKLGKKAIILDLLQVTAFNESGLGEIITAYAAAPGYSSYLSFVFSKKVIRRIESMKFLHVPVPYFHTLEEALNDAQSWCLSQSIYDRFASTD